MLALSSGLGGHSLGGLGIYARLVVPGSLFVVGVCGIVLLIDSLWLHNMWLSYVVVVSIVIGPWIPTAVQQVRAMQAARRVTDEHGQPYIRSGAANITLAASWPKGHGLPRDSWAAIETGAAGCQGAQVVTVARTEELARTYRKHGLTAIPGFPTVLYREFKPTTNAVGGWSGPSRPAGPQRSG